MNGRRLPSDEAPGGARPWQRRGPTAPALLALPLLAAFGCSETVPATRHRQTINRLRTLDGQLRQEREAHATAAATTRGGPATGTEPKVATTGPQVVVQVGTTAGSAAPPPSGPAAGTAADSAPGAANAQTPPPATAGTTETQQVLTPQTLVDRSGANPTHLPAPPALPSAKGYGARGDIGTGFAALARLYRSERKRIDAERRRWELERLRLRIADLQEARIRDALLWSRSMGGGLPLAALGGKGSARERELQQLVTKMHQQQAQTQALLRRLSRGQAQDGTSRPTTAQHGGGANQPDPVATKLDALSKTIAQQQAEIQRLNRQKQRDGSSAEALSRIREELRRELAAKSQTPAPAAAAQAAAPQAAPAAQPAATPQPRVPLARSSADAQQELDAQMQEAERLLKAKTQGRKP